MTQRTKKILALSIKLLLTAALLSWVLSKVHWRDFAEDREGRTWSVLEVRPSPDAPEELTVSRGLPWAREVRTRPIEDFRTLPGAEQRVIRDGFASSLRRLNPWLLVGGLVGFGIGLVVIGLRWWVLLRIQEFPIPALEALRLTMLGQFFNVVVPGTVGGDVVKAYYVSRRHGRVPAVLVSIFSDRLLGLTELVLMASVMLTVVLATGAGTWERLKTPAYTTAVILCGVIFALAFLLSGRFRRLLHLHKLYRRLPIAHHIAAAGDAARLYRRRPAALAKAVVVTAGAHVAWIGSIALLGIGLGLETPVYSYFVYIPLIYTLGAVPLTPGGVGLIEGFFVAFFQSPQTSPSEILVLAMLARLVPMTWGLPGLYFVLAGPRLPKAEQMQEELARREQIAESAAAPAPSATGAQVAPESDRNN